VRSIAILGAGELGGALARQLAAADIVPSLTLIDDAGTVAAGKALDIAQAAPVDGYHCAVHGTADEDAVVGADVIVLADRAGVAGAASAAEWQDDGGMTLLRRATYLNGSAVVVCAGARQLDLVERGVREAGIAPDRLFASAPEALRSAVVSFAALEADADPRDVSLIVVGRPPTEIIVPWNEASIAGRAATDVLSPPALTRLDTRLPRLWPPGPLTLAAAATRVLAAAVMRSARAVIIFAAGPRESAGRFRAGMLPARLAPDGRATVTTPSLSTRDRVRLESALQR
jgi:hypothetical protein